jgi:hypothetical protein
MNGTDKTENGTMTSNLEIGSKYDSNQSITDVAKAVRKDLKAAFPGAKFSVRTSKFSMGCSITVEPKTGNFPSLVTLRSEDEGADEYGQDFDSNRDNANALEAKIEGIVRAYGRFDVDSQTDYWNVSFYSHVDLSTIREAELEALRATRAAIVANSKPVVESVEAKAAPVAAATLEIANTGDAIADARNLLHARVEVAIEAGDVKSARRLLDAVKALY